MLVNRVILYLITIDITINHCQLIVHHQIMCKFACEDTLKRTTEQYVIISIGISVLYCLIQKIPRQES